MGIYISMWALQPDIELSHIEYRVTSLRDAQTFTELTYITQNTHTLTSLYKSVPIFRMQRLFFVASTSVAGIQTLSESVYQVLCDYYGTRPKYQLSHHG